VERDDEREPRAKAPEVTPLGAFHRSILDASPDIIAVTDLEGRLRSVPPAALSVFGFPDDEAFAGRSLTEFLVPEDREPALTSIARMLQGEILGPGEYRALRADGSSFPIEVNGEFIRDAEGLPTSIVFVVRDISARKQTETTLRERERMLDTLMSNVPGMVYRCANDPRWTMQFVSAGCEELTGYAPEALVGNAAIAYADLVHPEDAARLWDDIQAAIAAGGPWTCVYRITTASGEVKWVWERGVAVNVGDARVLEGFIQDVTSRREVEAKLSAAAAEWRETFDAMPDSVALFDDEGRVVRCNTATTVLTGRGFDDIIGRRCYEVFHDTGDYHESCPQRIAFLSRRSEASVFEQGGRWLRVTFRPKIDEDGRVNGGVHVVSDVTELKETEERLLASVARLEAVTDGVIAALSRSVEVRDPYTGGHERRVSELAAAIAEQLKLSEADVRCVRIAGMLHDIGKIVVPAEILTKPGRLSSMEFALIKGHPQAAHEILASIEFACPIAEVVLQHHERLDGSGYPAGLTADEILPAARVLAVADVMEAMISHRPYRAALPLEAAMAELEDGSGTRYDAAVCAAAVRLFREGAFTFSD
jgi:PAS domain S-box-containing protein/putative nucleotidyltransferase with HDIG domain